jgi:hypothetical protein
MSYGSSPSDKQIEHFDSAINAAKSIFGRRDIYRDYLNHLADAAEDMLDTKDLGIFPKNTGLFKSVCGMIRSMPSAIDSENFLAICTAFNAVIEQVITYHKGIGLFPRRPDLVSQQDLIDAYESINANLTFVYGIALELRVRNDHSTEQKYEESALNITSQAAKLWETDAGRAIDREIQKRSEPDADAGDDEARGSDEPA